MMRKWEHSTMLLKDILRQKGGDVYRVEPRATLAEVVDRLVEHNVGSLLVCQGEAITGIITERDILRACRRPSVQLDQQFVQDYMTGLDELITGSPDDKVCDVMGLLTEKRIRHLPILQDGTLVGMISIGDVVKAQHDHLSVENHYLKTYIQS